MKRNVMVLTGSRSEYGLLKNVLWRILHSKKLELYLIVTGTHLAEQYGYTKNEIENDGFEVWKEISIDSNNSDEEIRIPIEMGNLMLRLSEIFCEKRPDILLLLGDRYEG